LPLLQNCPITHCNHGAQGRNRTTDTAIFSRMLYQLSYLGPSRRVGAACLPHGRTSIKPRRMSARDDWRRRKSVRSLSAGPVLAQQEILPRIREMWADIHQISWPVLDRPVVWPSPDVREDHPRNSCLVRGKNSLRSATRVRVLPTSSRSRRVRRRGWILIQLSRRSRNAVLLAQPAAEIDLRATRRAERPVRRRRRASANRATGCGFSHAVPRRAIPRPATTDRRGHATPGR
jgi:hypothetical protein